MQPTWKRIGPCLNEFQLRMGCSGALPLLWLEAQEFPAQPASGNQRHYPLSKKCSLLFLNFQKDFTSEQLSWEFSHSKKRRFFCCIWSQHKDNPISCLFLCLYKCGIDSDNLKWLIDLAKKGIFYLMGKGKHNILMLFLQRFRNEWWQLLVAGNFCIWLLFLSFCIKCHSLWSLFTVKFGIYKPESWVCADIPHWFGVPVAQWSLGIWG